MKAISKEKSKSKRNLNEMIEPHQIPKLQPQTMSNKIILNQKLINTLNKKSKNDFQTMDSCSNLTTDSFRTNNNLKINQNSRNSINKLNTFLPSKNHHKTIVTDSLYDTSSFINKTSFFPANIKTSYLKGNLKTIDEKRQISTSSKVKIRTDSLGNLNKTNSSKVKNSRVNSLTKKSKQHISSISIGQKEDKDFQFTSLFNFNHSNLRINLNNNSHFTNEKQNKHQYSNSDKLIYHVSSINSYLKERLYNIIITNEIKFDLIDFIREMHEIFIQPTFIKQSSIKYKNDINEFKELLTKASNTHNMISNNRLLDEVKLLKDQINNLNNELQIIKNINLGGSRKDLNRVLSKSILNLSNSYNKSLEKEKEKEKHESKNSSGTNFRKSRFSVNDSEKNKCSLTNSKSKKDTETLTYSTDNDANKNIFADGDLNIIEENKGETLIPRKPIKTNKLKNLNKTINFLRTNSINVIKNISKGKLLLNKKLLDENSEVDNDICLTDNNLNQITKKSSKVKFNIDIPRLDSIEIMKIKDFNNEFLSKYNEFSESWREEVKKFKV